MAARQEIRDGQAVWVFLRLYCKRWACPYCGPIKAKQIRRAIALRAKEHDLTRFLTLTLDPKKTPRDGEHLRHIRETWRKFRIYIRREFGENLSFISVVEAQKNGLPHLHVLVSRYLHQAWVSSTWDRLGGGRIVDIRLVANLDQIGWYLGKYLTKDMILSAPRGVRRYSTSRDIRLLDKKDESGFKLVNTRLEDIRETAGDMVIEEDWDDLGHLKQFITAGPVDKMKLTPKDQQPTEEQTVRRMFDWWSAQRSSHLTVRSDR